MSPTQRRADGLVGERLGDYELVRVLGRGGQGVVYLANQPSLEREVVVKVLERDDGEALLREARLAARLDHPFAAHVYDHGVHPATGLPWVAMERARGTALDKLLAISGPPPTPRAIALLERLAQVIDAAHAAGIAHGDIKPSNVVVLTEGGRSLPKLIDFGLARPLDDRSGSTAGSPAYQPPERWAGQPPDRASDVYAFAALAYELLSGQPPFVADSIDELRRAHESSPVPAIGRGYSAAAGAAIAGGLAKDPGQRVASAGELASTLREATVGGGGEVLALPPMLHADLIAAAPQPIAACFAAASSAIGPHAQTAALRRGAAAMCHYVGLLALASAPPASWGESPLVRELGTRRLAPGEWLALARALTCRPGGDAELQPLPELARALASGALDAVAALAATESVADADRERALGLDAIEALAGASSAFELGSYRVAAAVDGGGIEGWSGPSPGPRLASPAPAPLPAAVSLLDRDGAAMCPLSPLVIRARPSPHLPEELFLFAGGDARGLRAVTPAAGFSIGAEPVRAWLAGALAEREEAAGPDREPYVGLASYGAGDADLFVGRETELDDALNHLRAEPLLAIAGPSGVGKSSLARAGIAAVWTGPVGIARPSEVDRVVAGLEAGALLVVDQLEELFTHEGDRGRREAVAVGIAGLTRRGVKVVITARDDFLGEARQLPELGPLIARGLQLLAPPDRDQLERIAREPLERVGYRWSDPSLPGEIAGAVAGETGALALISFACRKLWSDRDRVARQITRESYRALGGVVGALARHADAVLAAAPVAEGAAIRRLMVALITAAGTRWRRPTADAVGAAGDLGRAALDRLIRGRLVVSRESESGADEIEIVHESLIDGWPTLRRWRATAGAEVLLREQIEEAASRWRARSEPAGMLWSGDAERDLRRMLAAPEPGLSTSARRFATASTGAATRRRRWRIAGLAIAGAALVAAAVVFLALARRAERARVAEGTERARAESRLARLSRERGRVELIAGEPGRALRLFEQAMAIAPGDSSTRFLVGRAMNAINSLEHAIAIGAPIGAVGFSRDSDRLLVQSDKHIAVFDLETGSQLGRQRSSQPWSAPRWLTRDLLAFNKRGGDLGLWSISSGKLDTAAMGGKSVRQLRATTAHLLMRDRDGRTAMVDRSSGEVLWTTGEVGGTGAGFVRAGRVVLAETGRVTVRDAATGAVSAELAVGDGFRRIAVDRVHHRILVMTSADVGLFDESGRTLWRRSSSDSLRWARFGHGQRIAAVAERQDIELIDGADGRQIARMSREGSRVNAIEISRRNLIAVARDDGAIELYRTDTGAPAGRLVGHFGAVHSLAFDGPGDRLASGGDDGLARIWNVGAAIGEKRIRGRLMSGSSFSADGRRLAVRGAVVDLESGERVEAPSKMTLLDSRWPGGEPRLLLANDRRAQLWSPAAAGAELETDSDVRTGALSPSGERAAVADRAGRLSVFGAGRPVEVAPAVRGKARSVRWISERVLLVTHVDALVLRSADTGDEIAVLADDGADDVAVRGERIAAAFNRRFAVYRTDGANGDRWRETAAVELARFINAVALSPAGDRVVTCTDDGELVLHGVDSGARIADVSAHSDRCSRLAYVGDQLIASAGADHVVRLWSADSLELLAELPGATSSPALIVAPAADQLAATGSGGTAVWSIGHRQGSSGELATSLECRVAVELHDGRFVRRSQLPDGCAARLSRW